MDRTDPKHHLWHDTGIWYILPKGEDDPVMCSVEGKDTIAKTLTSPTWDESWGRDGREVQAPEH